MTAVPPTGNGLDAPSYVALADVDATVGATLLAALGRARIAAYLGPAPQPTRQRLFVASTERSDARAVVEVAVRTATQGGATTARLIYWLGSTRAEFDALVGDWHVDTVNAVRSAERDLTREDADWRMRLQLPAAGGDPDDEDDHYVPPAPPPLPRLAAATVAALLVVLGSVVVLAFGRSFGLPGDLAFLAGVAGILIGAGLLVMRLRERPPDEEDDDGAVL